MSGAEGVKYKNISKVYIYIYFIVPEYNTHKKKTIKMMFLKYM